MKTIADKLGVVQNLGLYDRMMRLLLVAILLGGPVGYLAAYDGIFTWWHGVAMLLSVYTGLTGYLGWDPLYQLAEYKSCGLSEKNQCGTLPYQVDAVLGHHPIPDVDYDHSLSGSHH